MIIYKTLEGSEVGFYFGIDEYVISVFFAKNEESQLILMISSNEHNLLVRQAMIFIDKFSVVTKRSYPFPETEEDFLQSIQDLLEGMTKNNFPDGFTHISVNGDNSKCVEYLGYFPDLIGGGEKADGFEQGR